MASYSRDRHEADTAIKRESEFYIYMPSSYRSSSLCTRRQRLWWPVLPFSKSNKTFFGYFNPENIFLHNEINKIAGWPNRYFRQKEALLLRSDFVSKTKYFAFGILWSIFFLLDIENTYSSEWRHRYFGWNEITASQELADAAQAKAEFLDFRNNVMFDCDDESMNFNRSQLQTRTSLSQRKPAFAFLLDPDLNRWRWDTL